MEVLLLENMPEGRRIKVARVALGLRQIDIEALAKVPTGTVSAIERGFYVPKSHRRAVHLALGMSEDSDG